MGPLSWSQVLVRWLRLELLESLRIGAGHQEADDRWVPGWVPGTCPPQTDTSRLKQEQRGADSYLDKDKETTSFSFWGQGDLLSYTCTERFLRGQSDRAPDHSTSVNFPETLALESILAKRLGCRLGTALSQAKYWLKARQSNIIGQRKPRRTAPIQVI